MSLSFMMSRSSPSILTSVPDHLPNSTRSPALTSSALILPVLVAGAGADGDDFALLRLFLGGVGNDDAAGGLGVFLEPLDDDAVVERTELHGFNLMIGLIFLVSHGGRGFSTPSWQRLVQPLRPDARRPARGVYVADC